MTSPRADASPSRVARFWRGWQGGVLRAAVAVLPLYFLAQRVPLGEVARRSAAVPASTLAWAFATYFLGQGVAALRWRTLLLAYGGRDVPSVWGLFRLIMIGGWFNALPSGLAGDALRGYAVRRSLPDLAASYAAIVVERIAGLIGLVAITGLAVASGRTALTPTVGHVVLVTALIAFAAGAIALFGPRLLGAHPGLRSAVARIPWLGNIALGVPSPRSMRGPLLSVVLSIGTQGIGVVNVGILVHYFAPHVGLADIAALVPVILLLIVFTITPSGVGQREWVFVYVLGPIGVEAGAAVAAAWVSLAVGLVATLSGLVFYARDRWSQQKPLPSGPS